MEENINKVGASKLDPSLTAVQQTDTKKGDEIGKNEFLQLLVTQLKSQDPLDPMKNEDFAVSLAQFTQVEQLVDINAKLGQDENQISSMAAYLGHEVLLESDSFGVSAGEGGQVQFNLEGNANSAQASLVNSQGNVVQTFDLGALQSGSQTLSLSELTVADGNYQLLVNANLTNGTTVSPDVSPSGLVTGFVPGPEPLLIVNGKEVSPGQIKEVRNSRTQ